MIQLAVCVLTGLPITKPTEFDGTYIIYQTLGPGKVIITPQVVTTHQNQAGNKERYPILAGICREAFEKGIDPPAITLEFMLTGVQAYAYPKLFKEKVTYLLNHFYDKGGNDYKPSSINSYFDYPLCYAEDGLEFERILNYLAQDKYWLKYGARTAWAQGMFRYSNVLLTDSGIEEVEKDKPKLPMIGLVDQEITTGNTETDQKINHARKLFFTEPSTLDNMRSACEALSYVLEPLR